MPIGNLASPRSPSSLRTFFNDISLARSNAYPASSSGVERLSSPMVSRKGAVQHTFRSDMDYPGYANGVIGAGTYIYLSGNQLELAR